MKGILILFGFAMVMLLAMLLSAVDTNARMKSAADQPFGKIEQAMVADAYPGGRFVESDTKYRRCEAGQFVYYTIDGKRWTNHEGCWR
jgi:hypothetical protein